MKKFYILMLFAAIATVSNICRATIFTNTFVFTSLSWESNRGSWESINDGYMFANAWGVCCRDGVKDVGAVSPALQSYDDIRSIEIRYVNYTGSIGNIDFYTGDDDKGYTKVGTKAVSRDFDDDAVFTIDNLSGKSGRVKFLVNLDLGMIYVKSITIKNYKPQLAAPRLSYLPYCSYNQEQPLIISTDEDGACIEWYIDNDQTKEGYSYEKSEEVSFDTGDHSISAYVTKPGYYQSETVSIDFYIKDRLAYAPTVSLPSGTYSGTKTLTITTHNPNAYVVYRVNEGAVHNQNKTATIELPLVEGEVTTYVIEACEQTDDAVSDWKTYTYTIDNGTLDPPTFSLEPGLYTSAQKVTISAKEGSLINYSVNGEANAAISPVKVELPLIEGQATTYTLTAQAFYEGFNESNTATAVYVINQNYEDKTATLDIAKYAAANGWKDNESYETAEVDGLTFKVADGDFYTGDYYSTYDSWATGYNGKLTITAPADHIIKSVAFTVESELNEDTFSSANKGELNGNSWEATDEPVVEVTFSTEDADVYLQKIKVDYAYDPVSSTAKITDGSVAVGADEGGIEVNADVATDVAVYNAAGQMVSAKRVPAGRTLINAPMGFYVVCANGSVSKVIVR